MSDQDDQATQTITYPTLRPKLIIPNDLPIHFVDRLSIANAEGNYYLSFFQTQPPTGTEGPDLETVEQRCVARIVLTGDRLQSLVTQIQHGLNDNRDSVSVENSDDED